MNYTHFLETHICTAEFVSVVFQASWVVAYEKPAPTGASKNIMLAVWKRIS